MTRGSHHPRRQPPQKSRLFVVTQAERLAACCEFGRANTYIVGDGDSWFDEGQLRVVEADSEGGAADAFIRCSGVEDEIFLGHVYSRALCHSFATLFAVSTPREREELEPNGWA